jgi:diketogulonate reductase-like aldo/keto reductase
MEQRPFGRAGVDVAVVGQGTWEMEADDRRAAVNALRRGIDLGLTHVDTAEMYGAGAVEDLVGQAIDGRRERVFLASKVLPRNASRTGTIAACEASLRRLRTDRLDLYLLHWPGNHPIADTIAAFEQLVRDGKIRFWGVSNFAVEEMEAALAVAGPGRIACNQVLYHLGERSIEHAVLPWCEAHDVAVVGYSPYGSGNFPAAASPGGRVLRDIGKVHGATARQVALGFLIRRPGLFTIPKAGRVEHVTDNAAPVALSAAEVERIAAAFPLGRRRKGVPTL